MRLFLFCAALGLAGCDRASPTSPDGAFRAFSDAARRHDVKAALGFVSTASRAALEAQAKAVSAASGGSIKDDPADLTFFTNRRPLPLVSVKVVETAADRAVLEVHSCQQPLDESRACPAGQDVQERVTMVKEAERWQVELPGLGTP